MANHALADLSFAELRDRLKARAEDLGNADDIDLVGVLHYLTTLAHDAQTPDSVDALFHLSRNFFAASQPARTIEAASFASRLAIALGQRDLLCKVRGVEGVALCDLGRFVESAAAYADFWIHARALGDIEREILAIKNVGGLYIAMAQWDVAYRYLRRSCEMAAEYGYAHLELGSRVNLANCALQLGDPTSGLRALLPFTAGAPKIKREAATRASAHMTLGHLYLATDELASARVHAQESGRWAKLAGSKRTVHSHKALVGLIEVKSGAVKSGLAALERGLAFAKRVDHVDVPNYLSMCVDACESAGQSDLALGYLHELVAWKKKLIDADLPYYDGLTEPAEPKSSTSVFDDTLRARAHVLQADVGQRVRRFLETAINAELASGHDLYRTFRVAKLAGHLAAAIGWKEARVASIALGAQLANIGMMAIPTRVLHRTSGLSDSERQVLFGHAQYGAELLRKPRLRVLNDASVVAEQHHERFDGSGYPRGLRGDAISEEARIISVCDAFDAMTHRRPWRETPLSIQAALNELKQCAGSQFDPLLVNTFVQFIRREFWEHEDFDAFLAEGANELEYVRVRARMEALVKS